MEKTTNRNIRETNNQRKNAMNETTTQPANYVWIKQTNRSIQKVQTTNAETNNQTTSNRIVKKQPHDQITMEKTTNRNIRESNNQRKNATL